MGIICWSRWVQVRTRDISLSSVFAASMLESVWIFCFVPQRCSADESLNLKFESWEEGWKKPVFAAYGVSSASKAS